MTILKEKFNEKKELVEVETEKYIVELTHYGNFKPVVRVSHKNKSWNNELASPSMSIEDEVMRVRTTMMGELSDEKLEMFKEQLEESQKLCLYLNAYLSHIYSQRK